ncbi:MAG TPA: hypothetical protein VEA16_07850, partial [Vicinamibacterales bacterium]|nr:hypothetical protein [Vicinamibacterales bacterium]
MSVTPAFTSSPSVDVGGGVVFALLALDALAVFVAAFVLDPSFAAAFVFLAATVLFFAVFLFNGLAGGFTLKSSISDSVAGRRNRQLINRPSFRQLVLSTTSPDSRSWPSALNGFWTTVIIRLLLRRSRARLDRSVASDIAHHRVDLGHDGGEEVAQVGRDQLLVEGVLRLDAIRLDLLHPELL